jgi:hypothetical protein
MNRSQQRTALSAQPPLDGPLLDKQANVRCEPFTVVPLPVDSAAAFGSCQPKLAAQLRLTALNAARAKLANIVNESGPSTRHERFC